MPARSISTRVPCSLSHSTSLSVSTFGSLRVVSIWISKKWAGFPFPVREVIFTGCPVVSWAYIPAAEMPIPCWPRLCRRTWNFDPYRSFPNTLATWLRTIPGPLSVIDRRKRSSASSSMTTPISGRRPASSQASSELSTASLVAVRSALAGLSKPRRWRFFWKNSATEISRCRRPIVSAVSRLRAGAAGVFEAATAAAGCATSASGAGVAFAAGFDREAWDLD